MKKKNFASFKLADAYKYLGIETLQSWCIEAPDIEPSEFFQVRLARLQKNFDLRSYEKSKELVIDAYCEEAINSMDRLKIWKGAAIEGDTVKGNVDYLIGERKDYLDLPFLCVVEAKKDNFEQGLAQCLVEMAACRWNNARCNLAIDIFGIVTNATVWQFYKLDVGGKVFESLPYTSGQPARLLGILRFAFDECCGNIEAFRSLPG